MNCLMIRLERSTRSARKGECIHVYHISTLCLKLCEGGNLLSMNKLIQNS